MLWLWGECNYFGKKAEKIIIHGSKLLYSWVSVRLVDNIDVNNLEISVDEMGCGGVVVCCEWRVVIIVHVIKCITQARACWCFETLLAYGTHVDALWVIFIMPGGVEKAMGGWYHD